MNVYALLTLQGGAVSRIEFRLRDAVQVSGYLSLALFGC